MRKGEARPAAAAVAEAAAFLEAAGPPAGGDVPLLAVGPAVAGRAAAAAAAVAEAAALLEATGLPEGGASATRPATAGPTASSETPPPAGGPAASRKAAASATAAAAVMFRPGFALAHFHKQELMQYNSVQAQRTDSCVQSAVRGRSATQPAAAAATAQALELQDLPIFTSNSFLHHMPGLQRQQQHEEYAASLIHALPPESAEAAAFRQSRGLEEGSGFRDGSGGRRSPSHRGRSHSQQRDASAGRRSSGLEEGGDGYCPGSSAEFSPSRRQRPLRPSGGRGAAPLPEGQGQG